MSAVLELTGIADVASVTRGLDSIGSSARDMAGDVASAASKAAGRLDGVADASDGVASKSSQATGGLGALAGGLEAVGHTGAADALNSAAIATDFLSGVGDIANLMLSTQAGRWIATKAAQVGYGIATKATTAAQWLLNAAMTANPIGLLVAAIVGLIAIVVIAYKKNEKFREVVDKVMAAVRRVVSVVITAVVGYFRLWGTVAGTVVNIVRSKIDWVLDKITGLPGKIKNALSDAGSWLVDTGKNVVEGLWSGISGMGSWLYDKVWDWVKEALPKPVEVALGIASPSRVFAEYGRFTAMGLAQGIDRNASLASNAAGRLARDVATGFSAPQLELPSPTLRAGSGGGTATAAAGPSITTRITINGAVDKTATARELEQVLRRRDRRLRGQVLNG